MRWIKDDWAHLFTVFFALYNNQTFQKGVNGWHSIYRDRMHHTIYNEFEHDCGLGRFLEFIRVSKDVIYRLGVCSEQRRSLKRRSMGPTESIVEAETYIEQGRKPVGLSISRHPFIPCNSLASFEDLFEVAKQPA